MSKSYKTKSGYVITEDMLEKIGSDCEKGIYPGESGRIIVAPVGRPSIFPNDELVTVAFKIPRSYRDKLDKTAKKKNETRSEYLREVLGEVLER
jgi:Arc/MetJ-type ribon-helix-helix transcriptional regulator